MLSKQKHTYIKPTIVVGLGRFGLGCLELLGERWNSRRNVDDNSLGYLRLLHVDYQEDLDEWVKREQHIADFVSERSSDDLPENAVNFLILRTLGLIRYNSGMFQVAMPEDAGLITAKKDEQTGHLIRRFDIDIKEISRKRELDSNEASSLLAPRLYKRKYFRWLNLSTDPVSSSQRLVEVREQNNNLHHFVGSIIHKVRLGHSPHIIIRMIARLRHLQNGYDPSPWHWLRQYSELYNGDEQKKYIEMPIKEEDVFNVHSHEGIIDKSNFNRLWDHVLEDELLEVDQSLVPTGEFKRSQIRIPRPFSYPSNIPNVPKDANLEDSVFFSLYNNMTDVLKKDFSKKSNEVDRLLQAPNYHLGMFDHDYWDREDEFSEQLSQRIKELGALAEQGLIQLWMDLELNPGFAIEDEVADEETIESILQSVSLLGEMVVEPFRIQNVKDEEITFEDTSDIWTDGNPLSENASNFLQFCDLAIHESQQQQVQILYNRLNDLGIPVMETESPVRRLYSNVALSVHEFENSLYKTDTEAPKRLRPEYLTQQLNIEGLRKQLNFELRHIYNFKNLKKSNLGIHRQPPFVNVFVISDFADPFSRMTIKSVIQNIAAELTRVVHSMFEIERGGVAACSSVIPLIWYPNRTDPKDGASVKIKDRNKEELVALHSIHGLRKWIAAIPPKMNNIRQIQLNSRMTDNAYWGVRESITHMTDFIEFHSMNDFTGFPEIDISKYVVNDANIFASFACGIVDFSRNRAHDYLATLLSLDFVGRVKKGVEKPPSSKIEGEFMDVLSDMGFAFENEYDEIKNELESIMNGCYNRVSSGIAPIRRFDVTDPTIQILQAFTDDLLNNIAIKIKDEWSFFTQQAGTLDNKIVRLQSTVQDENYKVVQKVLTKNNEAIVQYSAKHGVQFARRCLTEAKLKADENLRMAERSLEETSQICKEQNIPTVDGIKSSYDNMRKAALKRYDLTSLQPMNFLGFLMTWVLSASFLWTLLLSLGWDQNPSSLEWTIWRLGPWIFGGGISLIIHNIIMRMAEQKHNEFTAASESFEKQLKRLILEPLPESPPLRPSSLFAFFESRLLMTKELLRRQLHATVHEQVSFDEVLGERLSQSVDKQENMLFQYLEDLGVRLKDVLSNQQDVSRLFDISSSAYNFSLLNPDLIRQYYYEHFPQDESVFWKGIIEKMLNDLGGVEHWRKSAPLSNRDHILNYSRRKEELSRVRTEPIVELTSEIKKDIWEHFSDFVNRNIPNMGLGADFDGYQGLDPNGQLNLTDCTLVMHSKMHYGLLNYLSNLEDEEGKISNGYFRKLLNNAIASDYIQPNAIYLYSAVRGISPLIIQNIKRYSSPLERTNLDFLEVFPFSLDQDKDSKNNYLTMLQAVKRPIRPQQKSPLPESTAAESLSNENTPSNVGET